MRVARSALRLASLRRRCAPAALPLGAAAFSGSARVAAPAAPRRAAGASPAAAAPIGTAPAAHPYAPTTTYSETYTTSVTNPVEQNFAHVGRYFTVADEAGMKSLFPGGLAGDMKEEFDVTGTRMLMVRPTSVALTCHLEHFRQSSARSLASAGSSVKDVDASKPYAAPTLELPSAPLTKQAPNSAKNVKPTTLDGAELNDPLAAPFKPFRLLTGPLGVGKSAVLNHVVAYARRNQWLTVMIPNSWVVMHDGLVLAKSRRRPGMVDQHDIALKLLKETLTTHADILGQIPQRGAYATFRYLPRSIDVKVSAERDRMRAAEEDEKSRLKAQADATGKSWDPSTYKSKVEDESDTSIDRKAFSLRDMVEWGINHPTAATDTLLDFLAECREVTEFPVLFAVDGLNLLYEKTEYPLDGELLDAHQLSVPAAFHCLGDKGFKPEFSMKRGFFLATSTQRHSHRMRMFDIANVKTEYRVRVPELTRSEIHSQLLHYHNTGRFLMVSDRESVDSFAVEYYRTLCSGIPKEIFGAAMFQPS